MSEDKFLYQRDALEPRARSFTERHSTSPPVTAPSGPSAGAAGGQVHQLLPNTSLSPSAEVFRPRANTLPTDHMSRSLPTTVPESPQHGPYKRQGSRTPKRKDPKAAPRFYPAISKENVNDQVRARELRSGTQRSANTTAVLAKEEQQLAFRV